MPKKIPKAIYLNNASFSIMNIKHILTFQTHRHWLNHTSQFYFGTPKKQPIAMVIVMINKQKTLNSPFPLSMQHGITPMVRSETFPEIITSHKNKKQQHIFYHASTQVLLLPPCLVFRTFSKLGDKNKC